MSDNNRLHFSCEVITPLFVGGSDPRTNPELRSPSLRGAIRYWYRALLGGCSSVPLNSSDIMNAEQRVFGSTNSGSPVSVLVHGENGAKPIRFQKDRAQRTSDGGYLPSGKDYLLWSMAESGRPGTPRHLPSREYIPPGSKFRITLQAKLDSDPLKKANAALWLLANLGALGARANRGAGSFLVVPTQVEEVLPFTVSHSIDELQKHLKIGLDQCLSLIGGQNSKWREFDSELSPFDILSPTSSEIWIVADKQTGWDMPMDALNGIGSRFLDYRSYRNKNGIGKADHDTILNWMEKREKTPTIQRAVFGLPIPFRYSEGGPSDVIQSEISDRRASPLKIRITRLATGKYVGVMVLFKSQFLKPGTNLKLQVRKWKAPPPSDYSVIENFMRSFPIGKKVPL